MSTVDIKALRQGNRRALATAITLVESKRDDHRQQAQRVLEKVLPYTGNTLRIGITGVPGVGKSTFIEAFGLHLIQQGKKVAVLAVDPSSPVAGGSILGDKTRMEDLSKQEHAFIRPSPSEGALGGVAHKTRETLLLCEAAGYDIILVETVGVGQSEYEVASMVDFFLVLMLPNAGDELQGIKKGILELADALVINKADGENVNAATQSQVHHKNAFHLLQHNSFWQPQVLTCSALKQKNIDAIWEMINQFEQEAKSCKAFTQKRRNQNTQWMKKLLHEMIDIRVRQNTELNALYQELEQEVMQGTCTPYTAAKQLIKKL